MSEGPQVKLVTERLQRALQGRRISRCLTSRPNLERPAAELSGQMVRRIFCKGKHIFIEFQSGLSLHNHLLMRGKWRKLSGPLLLLPEPMWLALETDNVSMCNYSGQMLRPLDAENVARQLDSLGPDVMDPSCDAARIARALADSKLPVGQALLDQSVISGVGNVAKSEAMFLAGVHPDIPTGNLGAKHLRRLADAVYKVMWESYRMGGRWTHRVYRNAGSSCPACGRRILRIIQGPRKRTTYYCPGCQRQ